MLDFKEFRELRIARVAIAAYDLPLKRSWTTIHGTMGRRRGWLIRLQSAEGAIGFGECAPLPEAGTETVDAARATYRNELPSLIGQRADVALGISSDWIASPAARCGVETALLDLAAQTAGMPAAVRLNPQASEAVRVNAVLGPLDALVERRAMQAVSEGYEVLKFKLGLTQPAEEIAMLRDLVQRLAPGIGLRLDANGAWDEATARSMIESLAALPVEALEEPLAGGDADTLRRLQALAPWPLALDESLTRWTFGVLMRDPPVQRLILKPMATGGPLRALDMAQQARAAGCEVIVTTTVDAAVGSFASLHTAAALGGESVHGLATSGWLAEDVAETPPVGRGRIVLGDQPGLGVVPFKTLRFEDVTGV